MSNGAENAFASGEVGPRGHDALERLHLTAGPEGRIPAN